MTSAVEGSIQERLERRFDVHHSKPGRGNLTYVTVEQVTSRLNEVLGWDGWDFKVKEHGFYPEADALWCLGTLSAFIEGRAVVREQFGGQQLKRTSDDRHEIIDYGDDMKGAASDALKKCAMAIGVGLYLSEKQGGVATRARGNLSPSPSPSTARGARPAAAQPAAAPVSNVRSIDQLKDVRGGNGKLDMHKLIARMKLAKVTLEELSLVAPHPSGRAGAPDVEGWLERHPESTYYDLMDRAKAGVTDEPTAVAR